MKQCSVEGCANEYYGKGLCNKHWQRLRHTGSAITPYRKKVAHPAVCTIDGCDSKWYCQDFCAMHYQRFQHYGDPSFDSNHHLSETPEYYTWASMKSRCNNPNDTGYKDYGGRGIKVCKRWTDSFLSFHEDMGKRPTRSYSIERLDVNGDYEPSNCKWASKQEQARNTRVREWNTSGFRGVSWSKERKKWVAQIGVNGTTVGLGRYDSKAEAIDARLKAEKDLW